MATVNNLLTRIHDAEGALTAGNIPAGGPAAAANTDIFLQGAQSLGKRVTVTATTEGFALVDAADNDCSAASVHVGLWIWVTHYAILDDLRVAFSTGTTPSTNYDYHTVPLSELSLLGGFKRVWVDISRTPDGTGGTGLDEAVLRCYGVLVSFSSGPGGNAANVILDSADFVAGAALSLTGTGGVWSDFTTADENSTNQYGVFRTAGGVYNCFARVQLGTASSLVFNDSNFTIVFPQQSLVEDSFMGVTVDLQNAATNIDWATGFIGSSGAKQGDLVVTGVSGDFDATGMTFSALRLVTLTSVCSVLDSNFISCGVITPAGAILNGSSVLTSTAAVDESALLWDVAVNGDPDGNLDDMTFSKGTNAHHAISLTPNAATTAVTLRGITFTGFNATNEANDSVLELEDRGADTTWNINAVGTTGVVSYKKRRGTDTVNIIANPVTLTVTVVDILTGDPIQNVNVLVEAAAGGPLGVGTDIIKALTDVNGQVSDTRTYASNQPITGRARLATAGGPLYRTGSIAGTIDSAAGLSVTVQMILDT